MFGGHSTFFLFFQTNLEYINIFLTIGTDSRSLILRDIFIKMLKYIFVSQVFVIRL